ncbi:hypothetical protein V8F20_004364 [Naviculisporaceae sp. PSN 640]
MSPRESQPTPNGRTRTRIAREPRSPNGCTTCKRRRVKCDEVRPTCRDCKRLSRICDWTRLPTAKQRKDQWKENLGKSVALQPALFSGGSGEESFSSHGPSQDRIADTEEAFPIEDNEDALLPQDNITHGTVIVPDVHSLSVQYTATPPVISEDMTAFHQSATPQIAWSCPSPLVDTMVDLTGWRLPVKAPYTIEDHQALVFYDAEATFGFGSKSPMWSTHALLKAQAYASPVLSHLLLAAASGELWHAWGQNAVLDNAERHYKISKELLAEMIMDPSAEPLKVMACFWFLYLYQRRRPAKIRIAYAALSTLMANYLRRSNLCVMLSSSGRVAHSWWSRYSPKNKALLARLATWLFWVDTQACFQREGGNMARLLLASSRSSKGAVAMFDMSSDALKLNWQGIYPPTELVDDMINRSSLKLLHLGWVLFQQINELLDSTTTFSLDRAQSLEIREKIESLRRKPSMTPVFNLTESTSLERARPMTTSDWAVANFYALCIYWWRCSIATQLSGEEAEALHGGSNDDEAPSCCTNIAKTVDDLLVLIQKSLATLDKGQKDRMQWPLFWAGIETDSQFARNWISSELVNPELKRALQVVFLEQASEGGAGRRRISMKRIREICQLTCCDIDSGVVDMGIFEA